MDGLGPGWGLGWLWSLDLTEASLGEVGCWDLVVTEILQDDWVLVVIWMVLELGFCGDEGGEVGCWGLVFP